MTYLKGRKLANHMRKALDFHFPLLLTGDKRDNAIRCDCAPGVLVEKYEFQIGWSGENLKALEPNHIAHTTVLGSIGTFAVIAKNT